jgi:hypothetical protein
MIDKIPDLPGVGKVGHIPTIPELAEGGIVTQRTLAVLGEAGPEAVVPLGKNGGLGNTINVNITTGPFLGSAQERQALAVELTKSLNKVLGSKGQEQIPI